MRSTPWTFGELELEQLHYCARKHMQTVLHQKHIAPISPKQGCLLQKPIFEMVVHFKMICHPNPAHHCHVQHLQDKEPLQTTVLILFILHSATSVFCRIVSFCSQPRFWGPDLTSSVPFCDTMILHRLETRQNGAQLHKCCSIPSSGVNASYRQVTSPKAMQQIIRVHDYWQVVLMTEAGSTYESGSWHL